MFKPQLHCRFHINHNTVVICTDKFLKEVYLPSFKDKRMPLPSGAEKLPLVALFMLMEMIVATAARRKIDFASCKNYKNPLSMYRGLKRLITDGWVSTYRHNRKMYYFIWLDDAGSPLPQFPSLRRQVISLICQKKLNA